MKFLVGTALTLLLATAAQAEETLPAKVQRILTERCLPCHGPTPVGPNNTLTHIDDIPSLIERGIVRPGQSRFSKIWRRVGNDLAPMPPLTHPVTGAALEPLTVEQKAWIQTWIDEGAALP